MSELPVTTAGRVTDKYGGLLATGTSYGWVTVGGQPLPVTEGRKHAAQVLLACDEAEAWQALRAARQAAHDAFLAERQQAAEGPPRPGLKG